VVRLATRLQDSREDLELSPLRILVGGLLLQKVKDEEVLGFATGRPHGKRTNKQELAMNHDVCIIGGGIIGLATAWQLSNLRPALKIALLEKEHAFASHQTGRNSGVLHSGIYYKPGSFKAIQCVAGKIELQSFCAEHSVDHEICGKVIVAVDESEVQRLERIYERGIGNQVRCEMIGPERLRELEPHAAGVRAIHVPETGIVNYPQVCERLVTLLRARGHDILSNAKVTSIKQKNNGLSCVQSTRQAVSSRLIVNCAGLHSDRIARLAGARPDARIIPFRGEYFVLKPEAEALCKNLIYPVPDAAFPFLGVHFTRRIEGGVECGPNAVFAFAREGYHRTTINCRDLAECLGYSGFLRMACKHWRMGWDEMWRSLNKAAFVRALQRLMPEIESHHLISAPSGVRAQAVLPSGAMVDDFFITQSDNAIHVVSAPSPAATAALQIGRTVSELIAKRLDT
jgi:(S)-2-hydroxyglutarate dehydrogenase